MKNDLVFSSHSFRVHTDIEPQKLPMRAPKGAYFYLVTPHPDAPKKKYLHSIDIESKSGSRRIVLTHSAPLAKKFDNLRVAEAFADFLADPDTFVHEHDFWISLEGAGYQSQAMPRAEVTVLADVCFQ